MFTEPTFLLVALLSPTWAVSVFDNPHAGYYQNNGGHSIALGYGHNGHHHVQNGYKNNHYGYQNINELWQHQSDDFRALGLHRIIQKHPNVAKKFQRAVAHAAATADNFQNFVQSLFGWNLLNKTELMAINLYTQEEVAIYAYLNANLRSGSAGEYKDFLKFLCSGCKKLGPYAGQTIYRGASVPSSYMQEYQPGSVVTLKAVSSYSKKYSKACFFAKPKPKCTQFIFTLKTKQSTWFGESSQAHDASAKSAISHEAEVIVLPGTKVRVTRRYRKGKWVHIHLQEE